MTALKHWLIVLLICIAGGLGAFAQEAKPLRGVALIIGQSSYTHVTPLPNAGQDARAIGKLMTDLGFETRNAPDRNAKALKREIERFIEDAEGADVAFIYYAGHGIEAAGENWLVPVDADLSSLDDASTRLVAASSIVEHLKQTVPVVIFLLDACRNSPFPATARLKPDAQAAASPIVQTGLMPSRGMAPVEDQPALTENVGVVMGFAAEPGKAALDGPKDGNSPYAAALLRHLSASNGAAFGDVMTMVTEEVYLDTGARQRPWLNASMRRLLYFGTTPEEGDEDEARITGER
ncbi:MAG TPA: caspase family protein, partial [Nordella sp.]|nr:caspase family protein [Nordella sp.]